MRKHEKTWENLRKHEKTQENTKSCDDERPGTLESSTRLITQAGTLVTECKSFPTRDEMVRVTDHEKEMNERTAG